MFTDGEIRPTRVKKKNANGNTTPNDAATKKRDNAGLDVCCCRLERIALTRPPPNNPFTDLRLLTTVYRRTLTQLSAVN